MRASLLYNPFDAIDRLAIAIRRRRRRRPLRGTPAARLRTGHLDSLELLESLREHPPRVIYDVGANVGTWTCLAKSIFPLAVVEAFEPLAQHAPDFRRWTAEWPDTVRLHAVALGSSAGTAEIRVTDFSDASSLLPLAQAGRDEFHLEEVRREPVTVTTLDTLVESGQIQPPELIKLDVQGFELEVLRGAERCLEYASAVLAEVSFRPFYEHQALFSDVLTFLEARGFELRAFGIVPVPGAPLVQTDALFARR